MAFKEDQYLAIVKEIILSRIDRNKVVVFMFGSRATSKCGAKVDIDVGLWADDALPDKLYHRVRNAIDESIVPLKVDIVDFGQADTLFKTQALKDIVIWNMPEDMSLDLLR